MVGLVVESWGFGFRAGAYRVKVGFRVGGA